LYIKNIGPAVLNVQDLFISNTMVVRFCIFFLFISLSACQQDNSKVKQTHTQLQGKWMTKKAYRQGKNTRLLNDFYLEFNDALVQLNLPGETKVAWSLKKDTLNIVDHPFQKMVLHDLTDSTLTLSFDFNQYLYWVALEKVEEIH